MPTWRDEVSAFAEVGRGTDVRNVCARLGESHTTVVPTLLDSLGSDELSNLVPEDVGGHSDDECSSTRSESSWGEMSVRRSRLHHCPMELIWHTLLVEGVVVSIRGPTNVEGCDRCAFSVDAPFARRTKRLRIQMRDSQVSTVPVPSQSLLDDME